MNDAAVLILFFVILIAFWAIVGVGMYHEAQSIDYPRDPLTTATQQFGEALHMWPHQDMFGYKPIAPPDPLPVYTETVEEIEGKTRTVTEARVEQRGKNWNGLP